MVACPSSPEEKIDKVLTVGNNVTTFEVKVEVEKKGSERCQPISYCGGERTRKRVWVRVADKIVKVFHIDANGPKQAEKKARKHGKVVTVRKVKVSDIVGNIEALTLDQPVNPYENAIAMDEMIWKRKRGKRIKSKGKDKQGIDFVDE